MSGPQSILVRERRCFRSARAECFSVKGVASGGAAVRCLEPFCQRSFLCLLVSYRTLGRIYTLIDFLLAFAEAFRAARL